MKIKLPEIKFSIACLIIFTLAGFRANAQEVITLQKAVDRALERNLNVKQAQLSEALSTEDYNQARYNRLPAVSANPQASYNFGRNIDPSTNQFINQRIFAVNGNLTAQMTLFQGGQLRNQIIANRILVDVDKSNTAKVKNDLVLNVVTQYLTILTNQDLVTAAKQQIDISKIGLDRAQKQFDVGNQTLADLSQAKAQQSTADLNLTTAQNQLELSILILKQYMEMNPLEPIVVEKPDISKMIDVRTAYDPASVLKNRAGNQSGRKTGRNQAIGSLTKHQSGQRELFPKPCAFWISRDQLFRRPSPVWQCCAYRAARYRRFYTAG